MAEETTHSLRQPVQQRSRETLDRFVQAGYALIEEKPYDEITVPEIARRANSSVGAFYNRFASKDALFDYMQLLAARRAYDSWIKWLAEERWTGATGAEVVETLIKRLVSRYRKHPEIRRMQARRTTDPDPGLQQLNAQHDAAIRDALARLLRARGASEPLEQKIDVVFELIGATYAVRMIFPERRMLGSTVSEKVLVEELCAIATEYLGVTD